jgi:hypothetical protein
LAKSASPRPLRAGSRLPRRSRAALEGFTHEEVRDPGPGDPRPGKAGQPHVAVAGEVVRRDPDRGVTTLATKPPEERGKRKREDLPMVVMAGVGTIVVRGASLLFGAYLGRGSSATKKAWPTTTGKILTSRVIRYWQEASLGLAFSYKLIIFYSYREADGRQYEGTAVLGLSSYSKKEAQEWVQHNPPGAEIAVSYDPERPYDSALPVKPSGKPTALGPLTIETSKIRPRYRASETDYVMQWYSLHQPACWGSLSADNGTLTCVGCGKTKPLGLCPNCRHDQQFFRTEGDENWIPDSTSRGFTCLEGVEGYVRCHDCGNAWHYWVCECGTKNNIRQSIGWKDHITVELPKIPESACFIDTAVYGTGYAKEVHVLRRFRDEKLKSWRYGETMIRAYQKGSPPLADWIADKPRARLITRKFLLSPMVWVVRKTIKLTEDR